MDPRLKLTYYKENNIDSRYIKGYKQTITNLWNEKYRPTGNKEIDESLPKLNALSAHIFKKRKIVHTDELSSYLKEPPSNHDIDVLMYWKVMVSKLELNINIEILLYYIILIFCLYSFMSLNILILQKWLMIFYQFLVCFNSY